MQRNVSGSPWDARLFCSHRLAQQRANWIPARWRRSRNIRRHIRRPKIDTVVSDLDNHGSSIPQESGLSGASGTDVQYSTCGIHVEERDGPRRSPDLSMLESFQTTMTETFLDLAHPARTQHTPFHTALHIARLLISITKGCDRLIHIIRTWSSQPCTTATPIERGGVSSRLLWLSCASIRSDNPRNVGLFMHLCMSD